MVTVRFRIELQAYVKNNQKLSQPQRITLQSRRAALQRDIYRWSLSQGDYMPHLKYARANDDFSFTLIHGVPPTASISAVTPAPSSSIKIASLSPPPGGAKEHLDGALTNNIMDVDAAESIRLWLPSDVPAYARDVVRPPNVHRRPI
jgi:hypothetical protein